MKFGFVFQKDSHYKAVQATAMRILRQYPTAQEQFFAIDAQFSDGNLPINVLCLDIDDLDILSDCDFLFCCLGGYLLNKVIKRHQQTQTKIISLFPGVVSHYQLDAFISRFNADQVWLNCPADYELYTKLCQVFGVQNNGILYGASWFTDVPYYGSTNDGNTIFFEQTQIIANIKTAKDIEKQLSNFIQQHPSKPFLYKMRQNAYNEHLMEIRQQLTKFVNVKVVDHLTINDISYADTYISVSSSAIIEGVLLSRQCWLLSKHHLNDDAKEIFKDSNIFLDLPNQTMNLDWCKNRVYAPTNSIKLDTVTKQHQVHFNRRSLAHIVGYLLLIVCFYPKMFRLCFQKNKLKSIQKSLEYL